jgi:hypothetical protein
MRNLLGLTLILVGIFLMFVPVRMQNGNEPIKAITPSFTYNASGLQDYYTKRETGAQISRSARDYAKSKLSDKEFHYLDQLVYLESRWDNEAQNPHSTAYGLGQFLDQTWETVGYEKTDDPQIQIDAMIEYVQKRYGSFETALTAWYERSERTGHGWY